MKKVTLLICLLATAFVASAQVYTYRDTNGSLIFSDVPIPGKTEINGKNTVPTARVDNPPTGTKAPVTSKPKTLDEENAKIVEENKKVAEANQKVNEQNKKLEEENRKRQAEAQKQAEATKRSNCQVARTNLENAQSGRSANKGAAIQNAQSQVNLYCK